MTSQISANAYDRQRSTLELSALLGIYRIGLENIDVPPIPQNRLHNIARLKNVFRVQKCLRYDPKNFIEATISHDVFEQRSMRIKLSDGLTELSLAAEDSVRCLDGACRIVAAKSVLQGRDRWWTVKVYKAGAKLRDAFANQLIPADGTIYVNLQKSLQDNNLAGTEMWSAFMTVDKRRYYRQLCKRHGDIIEAFNQLLPLEPLFLGTNSFHLGVFHKLAALYFDEGIINYVTDIVSFWATVSNNGQHAINVAFIEALQGRCPRLSQEDHKHLQKSLEPDGILGHLSVDARGHIYHSTVVYNRTIPSLFTFFQDLKYIQICHEVLVRLLAIEDRPRHSGLKECFKSLFRPQQVLIQVGNSTFLTSLAHNNVDDFALAYWQLWLCAMRLWPFVLVKRGRKCRKSVDERFSSADRKRYWSLLARNVQHLGFNSRHIQSLVGELPELTDQPLYLGLTGALDNITWERYGIPFDDKYLLDRNSLFLPNLIVDNEAMQSVVPGPDVTTLLVRRSLFVRLFPDCIMPPLGPPEGEQPNSQARAQLVNLAPPESEQANAEAHASTNLDPSEVEMEDAPIQSSVVRVTPANVSDPSATGTYSVEVWSHGYTFRLKSKGSKNAWMKELRQLLQHKFTLWHPESLVMVSTEDLETYPQKKIMALPRGLNITRIRELRGMAVSYVTS